jgi:hypothetical protein
VHAHAESPQRAADQDGPEPAEEHERREDGGDDRQRNQHDQADAIEEAPADERSEPAHAHGDRVRERDPQRIERTVPAGVIGDQLEVREARRDDCRAGEIDPVDRRQPGRLEARRAGLELLRAWIEPARGKEHGVGQDRRHDQDRERRLITSAPRDDHGNRERTQQRAHLIQGLVHAERPAVADVTRGVRQHHVARRVANRLARALQQDAHRRRRPRLRERQRRHGRHLHEIARERDRPELVRPLAQTSGHDAQPIAKQLARSRHHRHEKAAGAEAGEKRTGDAARAFIRQIGEQTDDADQQHEAKGASRLERGRGHGDAPRAHGLGRSHQPRPRRRFA